MIIAKGIVIYWDKAREYIPLDLSMLGQVTEITKTIEYWYSTKDFVAYKSVSEVSETDGGHRIEVTYQHNCNEHIKAEDACWGKSIITIPYGATQGIAEWQDSNFPKKYNGKTRWEAIDEGLKKVPVREIISRAKRDQRTLRLALIATGASCALTGERTIEALEASHIIPSSENGAEVIENAILLRADLHRLYDNQLFSINAGGQVDSISDQLSEYYKKVLTGTHLNREASERAQLALSIISKLD